MSQPSFVSAVGYVGESFFTLSFDVALDANNPPPLTTFDVQINGTSRTVISITVESAARTVTVGVGSYTLTPGDIVEFTYSDPSTENDPQAIQGTDGTDATNINGNIVVHSSRPGPSAPAAPTLNADSDSGTPGDGITSHRTPQVSGTAGANHTVNLYDTDGTTLLGSATAGASGAWSITSSILADGAHTLRVTQTDGSNNISPLSAGLALTIDSVANAPTGLGVSPASDSGTVGDGISSSNRPTITGQAEANATVRLYDTDGTTLLGTVVANGSGQFSITTNGLTEGTHSLTAIQTDVAGNVSSRSSAYTYIYDATGPVGMQLSPTTVHQSNASIGSTVATLASADITSVTYGFQVGNGTIDADNGKFTISGNSLVAAQNLGVGTYHIYLSAIDAAGNGAYNIFSITVTDAPMVTSITRVAPATVAATTASVNYTVVFSQAVSEVDMTDFALTFTGSASGSISSVSGSGSTYTVTVNELTGDGTMRLDLKASGTGIRDGSNAQIFGGYTGGETYSWDRVAPTAQGNAIGFSQDTGSSASDLITSISAQSVTVQLDTALGVGERVQISLDNGTSWYEATDAGSGSWTLAGQTLSGSNTAKVRVVDAASNVGPEYSRAYVLDFAAPSFAPSGGSPADKAMNVSTTGAITLSFSEALDSAGSVLTSVKLYDVDTLTEVPATTGINGSGQLVITPTSALAASTAYYVNWGANALKDVAGNSVVALTGQTTYNFTTAAPPEPEPSTPAIPSVTVDGVSVQTATTTSSSGATTTTTTVAPVPANRPEDPRTPNAGLADIPLAKVGVDTVIQIGLPAGVGVTSTETSGTQLSLLDRLVGASQPIAQAGDFAQL